MEADIVICDRSSPNYNRARVANRTGRDGGSMLEPRARFILSRSGIHGIHDIRMIMTATPESRPDRWARLGGWLFPRRTWLPLPLVAVLLLAPASGDERLLIPGVGLVVLA